MNKYNINLRNIFPKSLIIIIIVGISIRVGYWFTVVDEAWFQVPGMDPEYYDVWAKDILNGNAGKYIPFPRGPLYPYVLALIKVIFGEYWLFPRILNLLADVITIMTIFHFGRLIAGNLVGIIASTVIALNGMMIYFSGELLGTSLEIAFTALYLFTAYLALIKSDYIFVILSGIILGLFSITRPNALILLILLPIAIGIFHRFKLNKIIKPIITHLFILFLCLVPITITNYIASGEFIPISTLGGVNFYIGNAKGASGWSSSLPGVGAGWDEDDAQRVAEIDAGRPLKPGEISNQLFKMGLREIKSDITGWLNLILRKIYYLIGYQEIGNNRPLELVKKAAPFIKIFMFISIGFILPISVWGLFAKWHSQKTFISLNILYIIIFGGVLVLFFISSRYRMPLLPALTLLMSMGIDDIIQRIKIHKSLLDPALVIFIGWSITMLPWSVVEGHPAQPYYIIGNANLHLNRNQEAIDNYKIAYEIDPNFLRLKLNMGVAYMQLGDTAQAENYFLEAAKLPQSKAEAHNNLGVIAETHKDLTKAELEYTRALEADAKLDDARFNLARVVMMIGDSLLLKGNIDSGEARYRYALKLLPDDPRPIFRLAVAAMGKGHKDEALRIAYSILEKHPDFNPAEQMVKSLLGSR